jgi:hypothetical protein
VKYSEQRKKKFMSISLRQTSNNVTEPNVTNTHRDLIRVLDGSPLCRTPTLHSDDEDIIPETIEHPPDDEYLECRKQLLE